jgi:hypothetical protein
VAPDRQFSDVSGEACGAEDVTGDGDFNPGLERQISPNPHSLHTPRDTLEDQVTIHLSCHATALWAAGYGSPLRFSSPYDFWFSMIMKLSSIF